LKYLLEAACNKHTRTKPSEVSVTTIFVYFSPKAGVGAPGTRGYIVKFQRIQGKVTGAGAWIRYNSNASFLGHTAASLFFVGGQDSTGFVLRRMFTDLQRNGTFDGYEQIKTTEED